MRVIYKSVNGWRNLTSDNLRLAADLHESLSNKSIYKNYWIMCRL